MSIVFMIIFFRMIKPPVERMWFEWLFLSTSVHLVHSVHANFLPAFKQKFLLMPFQETRCFPTENTIFDALLF
jgi:hypothetical protein